MNLDQQNYWWRISQSEIRNSAAAKSEGGQKSESLILVGEEGFEPSSLAAHAPRTCVFTGFHHSPIFYIVGDSSIGIASRPAISGRGSPSAMAAANSFCFIFDFFPI